MGILRFIAFALAVALAGCGSKAKVERLAPDAVVLAFGDSLTFGSGAAPTESYPAVLARRTGLKVVNGGVRGEVSAEGLARLPAVLEEVQPRLLVLCHGGNDFLRKMDEATAAANIRQMIELARSKGIGVVLLAPPKPGVPPAIPKFYAEIASALKVPLEDEGLMSALSDNPLQSDMVPPNATGYAKG